LADRTGIPEDVLEKIERNQTAPSYSQIRLLARDLQLTETELLTRAGYIRR
jgi:transcriptional regulator with XRE-family HTH domain